MMNDEKAIGAVACMFDAFHPCGLRWGVPGSTK